jgi:hypothetical protein
METLVEHLRLFLETDVKIIPFLKDMKLSRNCAK